MTTLGTSIQPNIRPAILPALARRISLHLVTALGVFACVAWLAAPGLTAARGSVWLTPAFVAAMVLLLAAVVVALFKLGSLPLRRAALYTLAAGYGLMLSPVVHLLPPGVVLGAALSASALLGWSAAFGFEAVPKHPQLGRVLLPAAALSMLGLSVLCAGWLGVVGSVAVLLYCALGAMWTGRDLRTAVAQDLDGTALEGHALWFASDFFILWVNVLMRLLGIAGQALGIA